MKKNATKKLQLNKETINLLNVLNTVQGGTDGTGSDPYSARCTKAMNCSFTCQPW